MITASPDSPASVSGERVAIVRAALVCVVSVLLGVLTAFAQQWLPEEMGSLANSSGSWALIAFLLAMLARGAGWAAFFGCLTLLGLLAGYVVGAGARGYPSSISLILFWGAAALLVGPLLGLGASWVKNRRGRLAAVGTGAMSGVLVGEGIYGLTYLSGTTYPPYWWGEITTGLILLAVGSWLRLGGWRTILLAAGVGAGAAAAFVVVYSQNLIMFF